MKRITIAAVLVLSTGLLSAGTLIKHNKAEVVVQSQPTTSKDISGTEAKVNLRHASTFKDIGQAD